MRKWIGLFVVASCLASAPAQAGWSFQQAVRNTGARGAETADNVSRVQVDGGNARIDFEKMAENPMFGAGGYMLLRSAAPKGMFMVNPAKKTYTPFDPEGLTQAMAPGAGAMEGSGMKMSVSDAKIEKLLEEPGGPIQGYSTTHYRYKKSYLMKMAMMNMEMITAHDEVEDVWLTSEIHFESAEFPKVMKQMGGAQMFEGMDKLVALEEQKATGFPLKRVTVDHTTPQGKGMMAKMMGGKEQTITTTLEITEIKEGSIPEATFVIPAGYSEVQMMQPNATTPNLEDEN